MMMQRATAGGMSADPPHLRFAANSLGWRPAWNKSPPARCAPATWSAAKAAPPRPRGAPPRRGDDGPRPRGWLPVVATVCRAAGYSGICARLGSRRTERAVLCTARFPRQRPMDDAGGWQCLPLMRPSSPALRGGRRAIGLAALHLKRERHRRLCRHPCHHPTFAAITALPRPLPPVRSPGRRPAAVPPSPCSCVQTTPAASSVRVPYPPSKFAD